MSLLHSIFNVRPVRSGDLCPCTFIDFLYLLVSYCNSNIKSDLLMMNVVMVDSFENMQQRMCIRTCLITASKKFTVFFANGITGVHQPNSD